MAFSSTCSKPAPLTDKTYLTHGTWTGTAVDTGELDTGLGYVENLQLTYKDTAGVATAAGYNETIPGSATDGVVTIVFQSGKSGNWIAIGRKR